MKSFLFGATKPDGIKAHERVEADNLDQARFKLEVRGYHAIEFLSDENAQDIEQASRMGTGVSTPDPRWWSAEDEVQSHRRRSLAEKLWWAFRKHLPFLLPLVFWSIISIWPVRPYRWIDYAGQLATPLYCLWFVKKVMPMTLFQLILEASVWHDWARLRRLIRFARVLRRFMVTGIPDKELDFREATAYAAVGRLPDGLHLIEKYRGQPELAEYLFLSRLSGVYAAAEQYDRVLALLEESAKKGPGGVGEWIDLALTRIRRKHDVDGAQGALKEIEGKEVPALAQAVRLIVEGMIACEQRDDVKACEYLRAGLDKLQATSGSPLVIGILAEARSYMALSLARLGKPDVARRILRKERELLEARKETDLLSRCDAAIQG